MAKRTAGKVNQTILEQFEMRERLVQAAMDGVPKFNAAALEGFCAAAPVGSPLTPPT